MAASALRAAAAAPSPTALLMEPGHSRCPPSAGLPHRSRSGRAARAGHGAGVALAADDVLAPHAAALDAAAPARPLADSERAGAPGAGALVLGDQSQGDVGVELRPHAGH